MGRGELLGLLAAVLLFVAVTVKEDQDVKSLSDRLVDGLPPRLAQWAPQLARAANSSGPLAIDTLKWSIFVASVLDRESYDRQGRIALKPGGPSGTGDWGARVGGWLKRADVADVVEELPVGWYPPHDEFGQVIPGPYAIPKDRVGWGRGLMQLDLGSYPYLLSNPDKYGDPDWNVPQGGKHLRELFDRLPGAMALSEQLQRTADAYNAGPRALKSDDPDALTTGGDYGTDVLARAASFEEAFA